MVQVVFLNEYLIAFWEDSLRKNLVKLNHPFNLFEKRKEIKFNVKLSLDDAGKFGSEYDVDNSIANVSFNNGFIELKNMFLNRGNNMNKILVENPDPKTRAIYFLSKEGYLVAFDLNTMTESCIQLPTVIKKPVQLFFLDYLHVLSEDGTVVMFNKDLKSHLTLISRDGSNHLYTSMCLNQPAPGSPIILVLSAATEYQLNSESVTRLTKIWQVKWGNDGGASVSVLKALTETVPNSEMTLGSPEYHFIARFTSGNFIAASMNTPKILIIELAGRKLLSRAQALELRPQERILCVKTEGLNCSILTSKGRCLLYSF